MAAQIHCQVDVPQLALESVDVDVAARYCQWQDSSIGGYEDVVATADLGTAVHPPTESLAEGCCRFGVGIGVGGFRGFLCWSGFGI